MIGNLPFYDIQDSVFILTYKINSNVNSEKKIYLKERKTSSTVTNLLQNMHVLFTLNRKQWKHCRIGM